MLNFSIHNLLVHNITDNLFLHQNIWQISQADCLSFTILFYFLGLFGIVYTYRNFLVTMMCVEVMYMGLISSFAVVAAYTADPKGQIYCLLLIVIAAAECALGLGILVVLFRFNRTLNINAYKELRG